MVRSFFVFCLFFVFITPALSWGFSSTRNQEYKNQLLQQGRAFSRAWLNLGHYHKTWRGHYQSVVLGSFFIAPKGAQDPQAELLATVDLLFSDELVPSAENPRRKIPAQCRYLARTKWLKTVLSLDNQDLVSCSQQEAWKKKLGATEAFVIFASGDLSNPGSSFGHTFLRLHNGDYPRQRELLDYGINFAAITGTESGALYTLKGLFGFYPGSYSMEPYHQKIQEYTNVEGRDLWEYHLNLTSDEVDTLIDHLLELDGSYVDYYFLDENCSYQILELLQVARPQLELTSHFPDVAIPLETLKELNNSHLLDDEKLRSSLQSEWRARYAQLSLREKKELNQVIAGIPQSKPLQWDPELSKKEKAEVLESSLSYLAVEEYRQQKEFKNEKYSLEIARAQLGMITDPVTIHMPASPLSGPPAQAFYVGYGQLSGQGFYDFKYRKAFHDLLSSDAGMPLFSHLEVFSVNLRYLQNRKDLFLEHWTIFKMLSTAPLTAYDKPFSWTIDIGTEPELSPYLKGGAGGSYDLPLASATRVTLLAMAENESFSHAYHGYFGPRLMFMQKYGDDLRGLLEGSSYYSSFERKMVWHTAAGISQSLTTSTELRLEFCKNERFDLWRLSFIF